MSCDYITSELFYAVIAMPLTTIYFKTWSPSSVKSLGLAT